MGRIFAVGDIHGCLDKLLRLMDLVDVNPERDTLLFVGDYIDRGPRSKEVVDYMIRLRGSFRHIIFLKGNHEFLLERYLEGTESAMFLANGGDATLESYMRADGTGRSGSAFPEDHLQFFNDLHLYHETDGFIFVHGGLRPGVPLEDQSEWDMLWIRDEFIYSDFDFGKRVIFGHTPFRRPLVLDNKIGIDTGAVYGNKLTCVELPAVRFYSV
ncbi:MAG: serine/threonine protein phosphatase [Deltaproteobacteria bacterium]|nr:serine/threonine protein phosphatase [Deltaproteobacteria bacterium]